MIIVERDQVDGSVGGDATWGHCSVRGSSTAPQEGECMRMLVFEREGELQFDDSREKGICL